MQLLIQGKDSEKKPSMYEGQPEMREHWMLLCRVAGGVVGQLKTNTSEAVLPINLMQLRGTTPMWTSSRPSCE